MIHEYESAAHAWSLQPPRAASSRPSNSDFNLSFADEIELVASGAGDRQHPAMSALSGGENRKPQVRGHSCSRCSASLLWGSGHSRCVKLSYPLFRHRQRRAVRSAFFFAGVRFTGAGSVTLLDFALFHSKQPGAPPFGSGIFCPCWGLGSSKQRRSTFASIIGLSHAPPARAKRILQLRRFHVFYRASRRAVLPARKRVTLRKASSGASLVLLGIVRGQPRRRAWRPVYAGTATC